MVAEIGDLCTLPTAERPLRAAEFDELFRQGVEDITRLDDTALDLLLNAEWSEPARELAAREAACCSFFAFSFRIADDPLRTWMRITVPAAHARILDAVADSARAAKGQTARG